MRGAARAYGYLFAFCLALCLRRMRPDVVPRVSWAWQGGLTCEALVEKIRIASIEDKENEEYDRPDAVDRILGSVQVVATCCLCGCLTGWLLL